MVKASSRTSYGSVRRWVTVVCLALFGASTHAQALLTLEQAMTLATARSQLVAAAQSQAVSAREMVAAAGQRPDPVLRFGLNNLPIDGPDRFSVTRDFMTMRSVGVTQEFTRGDKRDARTRRAESEVVAAQIARRLALAELRRDVATAWLERSLVDSMRELLRAQVVQADMQVQAAEALYRSGKGGQADIFAARGSAELLRDSLAQADRQADVSTTKLMRWIGAETAVTLSARPALSLPAWMQGDLAAHLVDHPLIALAAQQETAASRDADIARTAREPDWSVELMLSQRGSAYSNMVSLNVSLPLPWDRGNRQDKELAARLASVDAALARRVDAQRAHEAEVRTMLHEWRGHEERMRRYDTTLLPLAMQRSEAALTAYRGGGGALTAVLEARRSEIDLRMDRLRVEMDRARLWAQLNYLLPAQDERMAAVEVTR
jgi:outer membrane protein TolC